MGDMSLRIDRRRKDLAASFSKLKYMVDDIKSARKSLAAHHRLVAEFVSVSLLSAVPSSNASSPRDCASDLKLDDLQNVGTRSQNAQIYDSQDVGTILRTPIVAIDPALPIKSLSPELSAPMVPVLRRRRLPAPPSVRHGSRSALSRENLDESDSVQNKGFSFGSRIIASSGKLACQSLLWASLLLMFLCFFLFMGKKVAIGITVTAYCVLWLAFKGLSFLKRILRFMRFKKFDPQAIEKVPQKRSSRSRNDSSLSASEPYPCKGGQSLPMLDGCPKKEGYTMKRDLANKYASSSNAATQFARLKLGILLVLALCGLAHGQIIAVCMCSSCALMVSQMQRLASKRYKQWL